MPLDASGKFDSMMKIDVIKNDESTQIQVVRLFTLINEAIYQLSLFWVHNDVSVRHLQEKNRIRLQEIAAEIYLALTGERVTPQEKKSTSGDQEYDYVLTMSKTYFTGFNSHTGQPTWNARDVNYPTIVRYRSMSDANAVATKLYATTNDVIEIARVPRESIS